MGRRESLGSGHLPSLPPPTAGNASKSLHILLLLSLMLNFASALLKVIPSQGVTGASPGDPPPRTLFPAVPHPVWHLHSQCSRCAERNGPPANRQPLLLLQRQKSVWIQKPLQTETAGRWVSKEDGSMRFSASLYLELGLE